MNKTQFFTLTASVSLAIILTACASNPPAQQSTQQPAQQQLQQPAQQHVQQPAQQYIHDLGKPVEDVKCVTASVDTSGNSMRDWGRGGPNVREQLAANMANLDARSKLASQIEFFVSGKLKSSSWERRRGKAVVEVGGDIVFQQGYFDQFLRNSSIICTSRYFNNGNYNVYSTAYMVIDENLASNIVKQLTQDEILEVDEDLKKLETEVLDGLKEYRKLRGQR